MLPKILIPLFLLPLALIAQPKLEIHQIANNAFIYTTYKKLESGLFPSNGLYLVTPQGVAILDTPWDESQFQPLLDSIQKRHNQKAVLCISTHSHDDRTAGLEYFQNQGIKTYASAQTKKLCIEKGEKQPEFTFKKDTVFRIGDFRLETFYPGEGHTPDNIVVWIAEISVLYAGCFAKSIENSSIGNIADANLKQWPKSIRKTQKRFPNAKNVIPGHFKWSGKEALDHTIYLINSYKP